MPSLCLYGLNSPSISSSPTLQVGGEDIPVQLPLLWPMHSPRVFTKVLKSSVEMLRSLGIYLVIYMDDMLLMTSSKQELMNHVQMSLFLLENRSLSTAKNLSWPQPNRISGNDGKLSNYGPEVARRKNQENQAGSSLPDIITSAISSTTLPS